MRSYPLPCPFGLLQSLLQFYFNIANFVKTIFRNMNKRLLQFLGAENITQSQLAEVLGVANATVSNILSGRNRPGFDFIESLLLHYPELNLSWLITGKGKMYEKDPAAAVEDGFEANGGASSEFDTLSKIRQSAANQRKIIGVCVFFDDGTFQDIRL